MGQFAPSLHVAEIVLGHPAEHEPAHLTDQTIPRLLGRLAALKPFAGAEARRAAALA